MEIQADYRDLLKLFNEHEVEYIIVGAFALAFYGVPRFTGDIDIYLKPGNPNADRIILALNEFGFGSLGLKSADFEHEDQVIQLGVPPVRIDLITSLTGVCWEEVYINRLYGHYGDVEVCFIGRDQFIKNKRATGRKKDLADLEMLGEEV
jgi:hypothetical protein